MKIVGEMGTSCYFPKTQSTFANKRTIDMTNALNLAAHWELQ